MRNSQYMKQPSLKQMFNRMHSDHAYELAHARDGKPPHQRTWPVSYKVRSTLCDWGCYADEGLSSTGLTLLSAWERQEAASKVRRALPMHEQKPTLRAYCEAHNIQLV